VTRHAEALLAVNFGSDTLHRLGDAKPLMPKAKRLLTLSALTHEDGTVYVE